MIYLACPYAHETEHMEHKRYEQVTSVAAKLMLRGLCIYSPITSMHYLARKVKANAIDWLQHDLVILARCDKLIVLQLEGWENSVGLKKEIAFASENNIPVEYITLGEFSGEDNQHRGA
jgi:hypothetical protein